MNDAVQTEVTTEAPSGQTGVSDSNGISSEMSSDDMELAISNLASEKLSDLGSALQGEPVSEDEKLEEGETPIGENSNLEAGEQEGVVPLVEHAKLQAQMKDTRAWAKQKEDYIQTLHAKLGESRQQSVQLKQDLVQHQKALEQFINENNIDKPLETAQAAEALKQVKLKQNDVDQKYSNDVVRTQVNSALVQQGIDPATVTRQELNIALKDIGYSNEQIGIFNQNPFCIGAPQFVALVQTVKLKQALVGMYEKQVATQSEYEKLKSQSTSAVDRIMQAKPNGAFPGKLSTKLASGDSTAALPSTINEAVELSTEQLKDLLEAG